MLSGVSTPLHEKPLSKSKSSFHALFLTPTKLLGYAMVHPPPPSCEASPLSTFCKLFVLRAPCQPALPPSSSVSAVLVLRHPPQQVPDLGTGTEPLDREENQSAAAGLSKLKGVFKSFNGSVKVILGGRVLRRVLRHTAAVLASRCCGRHFVFP